jgi:uncharacterized protein
MHEEIQDIGERVVARLRAYGPVAVAFSGGVDSAVVARAAVLAWQDAAVAITAVSPSLAASEREDARRSAAEIGIRHVELSTNEFQNADYRRNAPDRCFHCKDTLYELALQNLDALRVGCIVNGANLDDTSDYRPGMAAADQHKVHSPLIEESLNKQQVRALARHWGLSVADKPASPCLSSRIAYGVEVTEERVGRVEAAEAYLRQRLALTELRVRCESNELARIELPVTQVPLLTEPTVREDVVTELLRLGFRYVTVDLQGFRSGSLNAGLPLVQLSDGA